MKKKGSVFILALWIMLLVGLLAAGVAMRLRLAVQVESYDTNRFRARYDFLSAVNLARFFIESDKSPGTDSRRDAWYGNPPDGFDAMQFSEHFEIEITDVESKVNINQASEEFLVRFFEVLKNRDRRFTIDAENLAASIALWRGGSTANRKLIRTADYKKMPFESIDEIRLVPMMKSNDFERLKPFITVFGDPRYSMTRINLNTVHPYVLEALVFSLQASAFSKRELWEELDAYLYGGVSDRPKAEAALFEQQDLAPTAFIQKLGLSNTVSMQQIAGQLLRHVVVDSRFFFVTVRSKRSEQSLYRLETVLGPRDNISTGTVSLARSGFRFAETTPLEILSWEEIL